MRTLKQKQYVEKLRSNLTRWVKRKSRRIKTELVEASLILMGLNLDRASEILQPLYSENPRGRKPYDPICMLRALLLMVILKYKSLPKFAKDLKAKPRLAKIAGFVDGDVPVAGTFYLFIDRLEDGEYQKPCQHIVKKSKLRKGKHLRNLTTEKEQRQIYTKMGPVVYVRTAEDPRLYPQIRRDTDKFKRLYNQRSTCERSNSQKKETYRLKERPCRNSVHFLVRLYLVSIIEHAKAWFHEIKKQCEDDPIAIIKAMLK